MFPKRRIGAKYESSASIKTIMHRITAIITYATISLLDKSIVSSTIAVIPPTLVEESVIFLISSTASRVFSFEVDSVNVISINSALPLDTLATTSLGSISFGIVVPVKSVKLTTFSTPSIFFILSSNIKISYELIFSTTTVENAPILKSSARIS